MNGAEKWTVLQCSGRWFITRGTGQKAQPYLVWFVLLLNLGLGHPCLVLPYIRGRPRPPLLWVSQSCGVFSTFVIILSYQTHVFRGAKVGAQNPSVRFSPMCMSRLCGIWAASHLPDCMTLSATAVHTMRQGSWNEAEKQISHPHRLYCQEDTELFPISEGSVWNLSSSMRSRAW